MNVTFNMLLTMSNLKISLNMTVLKASPCSSEHGAHDSGAGKTKRHRGAAATLPPEGEASRGHSRPHPATACRSLRVRTGARQVG